MSPKLRSSRSGSRRTGSPVTRPSTSAVWAARAKSLARMAVRPSRSSRSASRSAWATPRGESGLSGCWTVREALPRVSPWRIRKIVIPAGARSDHALAPEIRDVARRVAEAGQDLLGLLAEPGRGATYRQPGGRHANRGADVRHAPQLSVVGVDHHLAVDHLRIGKQLLIVVDRPARHARVVQHLGPVRGGRGEQDRDDLLLQREPILSPLRPAGEARVGQPLRVAERAGAALPDGLTGRADHHVAVLGLEAL